MAQCILPYLFLWVARLPSISFREIISGIRVRKRGPSVKHLLVVIITHLLLATVMVLITTLQPITGILIENHSTVEVIVLAVVVGLLVRLLLNQRSLPLIILLWILWTLNVSEGLYYEIKSWLNNSPVTTEIELFLWWWFLHLHVVFFRSLLIVLLI